MNIIQQQSHVATQKPGPSRRQPRFSLRSIALFKRLPRFRPLRGLAETLITDEERAKYPALTADLAILDQELMPSFHTFDKEALRLQNAHWWTYIILIVGGAIATILGILQLALENVAGLGIAGALVAAFLGSTTLVLNAFHYQARYMNYRLAAEELHSEYFLFLGHIGDYAGPERRNHLRRRVRTIEGKVRV